MPSALSRSLRWALDPAAFARACGIAPDPWQVLCLEADQDGQDQLFLCSRQSGKSTTAALIATRTAVLEPGALIVCASPSQFQSDELLGVIGDFFDALEVEVELRSTSRIKLRSGSRIVARHAQSRTVRGLAGVTLLVLDEAARVPPDLISALTPMLATRAGRLIALSTPAGRHPDNWFANTWHDRSIEAHRVCITADQCPRLSPAFLEKERRRLGDMEFRQEYYCEFLDSEMAAFPVELINACFTDEFQAWRL